MTRGLRFRPGFVAKIASMPVLAGAAFLVILVLTRQMALENDRLMGRIEVGAVPALELSRDLQQELERAQRMLQDAVTAADPEKLAEADDLHDGLRNLLRLGQSTIPSEKAEFASLEGRLEAYYPVARSVALRMIEGEAGPGLEADVERMSRHHQDVRSGIQAFSGRLRRQVEATFAEARANHARSIRASSVVIVGSLLAFSALSLLVVRSTVRPLARALEAAEALAVGDLSGRIEVDSEDEIGRLLRAMDDMMAYLREMAQAADGIAAGDLRSQAKPRSVRDRFGNAFARMTGSLEQMTSVAERIAAGDRDERVSPRSPEDRFSHALNAMVDSLAGANAAMAKAARLKDEFLANMSHELRTPLNAVLGMSEALLDEVYGPLNERQRGSLTTVEASGRHLLAVINDILDLSKIEAGKLELEIGPVHVGPLCQDSLRFVAEAALRKGLRVSASVDPRIQTLRADERRLRQVLINLLSNAVKFTPEGGQIGLDVAAEAVGRSIRFTAWDTGIGISQEDQARLFQPFSQVDSRLSREYCGTGLGLALVRRMVEMHGGAVSVESEPGKGSRFTVTLPWQEPDEVPGPAADAESAGSPREKTGGRIHILLAEDNDANVATVADYLQSRGYRLSVARDGSEAVTRARQEPPDLILMDVHMPGMDGLEATRRIRSLPHLARIPIIALTSLAMSGDRERCLRAGADDHMTKPLSLKALAGAIEALLRRRGAQDRLEEASA